MKVLNQMFTCPMSVTQSAANRCKERMEGSAATARKYLLKQSTASQFCFYCFLKQKGHFSVQLSNSSCKHIGVKTPLASCSYHTLLFHSSILKSESALRKFCMLLWSCYRLYPSLSTLIFSSLFRLSSRPTSIFTFPSLSRVSLTFFSHFLCSDLLSIYFSSSLLLFSPVLHVCAEVSMT